VPAAAPYAVIAAGAALAATRGDLTALTAQSAVIAAVIEGLVARGITPPVFLAANVDGGAEWNKRLLAENADRIFYL